MKKISRTYPGEKKLCMFIDILILSAVETVFHFSQNPTLKMDPGSFFASGFIALVLIGFGIQLGRSQLRDPPVIKKEEEEKKVVEPPPPADPAKPPQESHLKEATIMWSILPLAFFFLMMGNCKFFSLILFGTHKINHLEVYIFQQLFLRLAYGLFGFGAMIIYLWNLPRVAKKIAKKFTKKRTKENRAVLSTPEAFLEAYLFSIQKEEKRRASIVHNDHPLDNIGLQTWFQLCLYCLPVMPCVIGMWWAFMPLSAALIIDIVSGLKMLRYFFLLTLGTNSLLKVEDAGLEYRFKPIEDKSIPATPPVESK
jgi:hypothetical protein